MPRGVYDRSKTPEQRKTEKETQTAKVKAPKTAKKSSKISTTTTRTENHTDLRQLGLQVLNDLGSQIALLFGFYGKSKSMDRLIENAISRYEQVAHRVEPLSDDTEVSSKKRNGAISVAAAPIPFNSPAPAAEG